MSSFQQAQAEGLCLRYPDNLGLHREITYETAVNMLLRAIQLAQTVPFSWGYIDKPSEGQAMLLCIPPQAPFPNDGIRYQDNEVKYNIPVGSTRELEVYEIKNGFIPGVDPNAWRIRRRYRLCKGGHPQFVLVHYPRGPQTQIVPSLANQPVRVYPLRVINEPPVYVVGEKAGQKVFPPGAPMHATPAAPPMPPAQIGMGMNFTQQQAMVAQQNNNMEMLERRRERERESHRARDRSGSTSGRPPPEDDSGDETDLISTRTLAKARYKRNHDIMNEVFKYAAFGDKQAPKQSSPFSIFDQSKLDARVAKLQLEIEELKSKSGQRRTAPSVDNGQADVSMETLSETISV